MQKAESNPSPNEAAKHRAVLPDAHISLKASEKKKDG
jgi:hypothetical protein